MIDGATKDTVVTMLSEEMTSERIWRVAMTRPVTPMEWFFGISEDGVPVEDVVLPGEATPKKTPKPKKTRKQSKPRGEQDQHVPKGPDPYRGQHRDDGRGNRTGKRIRKKLTVDQVKEIKQIIGTTSRSNKDIAKEYGVSRETISHIRRGLRWAEV
ncbi:MAG: hypothetical protein RIT45_1797 [Pseudomonadota bacterium]